MEQGDKEARPLIELSETIVEFWDAGEHQRDHEAFKKWQRRNSVKDARNA